MTTKGFIPPHGGYRDLLSYKKAEIVFDATVFFCNHFIEQGGLREQMTKARLNYRSNA